MRGRSCPLLGDGDRAREREGDEGELRGGRLEGVLAVGLLRGSRLEDSGTGPPITGACILDLRVPSLVGEASIETVDDDVAGTADCDFGDGIA